MVTNGNIIAAQTCAADDLPRCPQCDYIVAELTSQRCPECGQQIPCDRDSLRPSRRATPWSATNPLPLWRGVWESLGHPLRSCRAAADPQRVTFQRAALFAAAFALVFLVTWGPQREFYLAVHVLIRDRAADGIISPFRFAWNELHRLYRWGPPALWLASAQIKWWLLFGMLALTLPREKPQLRTKFSASVCALLLFSPWFFLLDLMCSMTVWAAQGSCIPEPNTMWPFPFDDWGGLRASGWFD